MYRFTPHSSDDDDRTYREPGGSGPPSGARSGAQTAEYVLAHGILTEEEDQRLKQEFEAEIDAAVEYAEAAPGPDPSDLVRHVSRE